ncbi:MAG: DUF808 domain-containing protein [Hyphomicrobiaceae bacterium]
MIDDAAVTPRYVVGLAAKRELPIIAQIAWGSLKNKLLYLLPGALALSYFAPWAITPLLMAGGIYLCFEGYEKAHHMLHLPAKTADGQVLQVVAAAAEVVEASAESEQRKVQSAIRTDFILSAEIMAISLATITAPDLLTKAVVLALVGLLVTLGVYGIVALIVKADDIGVWLAKNGRLAPTRAFGRWLVTAMPPFLNILSVIGMLAMLWVGGGIILHGLEQFGFGGPAHTIHGAAAAVGAALGPVSGFVTWLIEATAAGVLGLMLGWFADRIVKLFAGSP